MTKKILIIDDEINILNFIRISLKTEGFTTLEATDSRSGLNLFKTESPHLIILDLGLPDEDGLETLRQIRLVSKTPVIILTARDEESEKVRLLNAGANDYLSKPFGIKELVARIKVLLRDLVADDSALTAGVLEFDEFTLNTKNHTCTCGNKKITLTKKEFELLSLLSLNAGKLITYKEILASIWGGHHEDDSHYIRIIVSQIRKKIDSQASCQSVIKTEPGVGCRLVAKPAGKTGTQDD